MFEYAIICGRGRVYLNLTQTVCEAEAPLRVAAVIGGKSRLPRAERLLYEICRRPQCLLGAVLYTVDGSLAGILRVTYRIMIAPFT